jgi:hypothetical protein
MYVYSSVGSPVGLLRAERLGVLSGVEFFFFFVFRFSFFFFSLWREKEISPCCNSGCYSGRGVPGDAVNSNTIYRQAI